MLIAVGVENVWDGPPRGGLKVPVIRSSTSSKERTDGTVFMLAIWRLKVLAGANADGLFRNAFVKSISKMSPGLMVS